ncbi:MAG: SpoIIE family protein phosphatase [Candidatus Cloacimonetes bacterium]|nr:SpoIIE family protein phosphatase [Candidatus Cloacimonadota bacterium]
MQNKLRFFHLTKCGKKTDVNEDSIAIPTWDPEQIEKCNIIENKGFLFVLCDGMGGHLAGNIASHYCSNWMLTDFYNEEKIRDHKKWLSSKIIEINNRIYQLSLEKEEYRGMGTTMVSLLIKNKTAYINNVGDSRLYLYTNKELMQITEDHSLVWEYYKQKKIKKEEMLTSKLKHIITEAVGLKNEPKINEYKIKVPSKFCFLMCSDGITDFVLDKDIKRILKKNNDLQSTAEELCKLAEKNKSRDDITIILIRNY